MKFKFVSQLESNDCGPACLSMILNYYGKTLSLKKIKELCSVTRMGVSVKDILEGGRNLKLDSYGLNLTPLELSKIPLPAILFWKQDHYVVLYEISNRKGKNIYNIADPAYGKTKIEEELLEKEWIGSNEKGICLVFQKTDDFEEFNFPESKKDGKVSNLLSYFLDYIKKRKTKYFLSFFLLVFGLATNWVIPILFKKIIDDGILAKSLSLVYVLLLSQLLLFLGNFCSRLFSDFLLTKFNFDLSVLLKENFLKKLIKLPINYFDTRLNTDTLLRLSDLTKIQSFLTWKGVSFLINCLNLIAFSLILLYLDNVVFIVYLVLSSLSILWVSIFLKRRASLEYSMFIRQSDNSNNLYEFVMNMPEIKVNQAQNSIISRITSLQVKLNDLELKSLYLNMYQLSGANFILKLKELSIIAFCAYLIINSQMTVGTLLSISYIIGQLSGPIMNLINNFHDVQDALISNKRVDDVYGVKDEENDTKEEDLNLEMDDIILKDLSFKYPGSFNPFVLNNLSFEIPKNKITAIVGTSGSGKTTLMKLLMKYYNPDSGNMFLGSTNFTELHSDAWRKKCGVVLQDGHIFSGTIEYNISLCESDLVDREALDSAIRIACLDSYVNSLAMGINTKIGNIGIQISGGQSQRILIARAVYKNPEFIFFDEATSSLDANTERSIIDNLGEFFKGRTVIVVAHRLSTVKNADQIIVMENGEVIEKGSHSDLLKVKDKYYSLVKNQLELGN